MDNRVKKQVLHAGHGDNSMRRTSRTKRHLTGLYILLFSVIILFAGGFSLFTMHLPRPRSFDQFVSGGWALRFEQEFEAALPLRKGLISLWNASRFLITGEGADGVLIGEGGWLYTAEEWRQAPEGAGELLRSIPEIQRRLAERDIELVIVPVPAKNTIYNAQLSVPIDSQLQSAYENFLNHMKQSGIHALDLRTVYLRERSRHALYLRTDTHWTPEGARIAAEEIRRHLDYSRLLDGIPRGQFASRRISTGYYRGDLFEFLPDSSPKIGVFSRSLPREDRISQWEHYTVESPQFGLFDTPRVPVALVGTSYSAGEAWGFEGFLRGALEADVVALAREGRGPLEPMLEALEGQSLTEFGVSILLWEIPLRYIGAVLTEVIPE